MSAPTKQTAARRPAAPKANSRVTQYVDQQLERTRRQVKSTDLIAAGLLLVVMVVSFLLFAAIVDAWVLTLTPLMRWSALLLLVVGCVSMMVFSIWPLLTKQINPDYAAKMLEDSKPGFRNSVLNYVWFRKKPDGIRSAVFDAVARQAAVDLNSVPADSSVDRSKVIRLGFWLVGVTAAFIVYFMLSPKNPFQTLNRVIFPAADLAKPAVVTIADVTPGNSSVFFGDQVEITAKVYGQHSPEDVQLIYSTNDGRQSGQVMAMQPDPTTPRQYKIDLTKNTGGMRESLEYEIVARDGQSGKFEIKVEPRPSIAIESIQIQPPKYTKLKPQTTLQGAIDGVEGSMVIVRAEANLEIEKATIELLTQLPTAPNQDQRFKLVQAPLNMKVESKSARRTFQLTLDSNREKPMATHYRLNFRSVAGKSPETPNVYPIRIIPDLAPELEVRRPTAPESKVPANGRLAVVAIANDLDYEISFIQINVEFRGNEIASKILPLTTQADNGRKAQARFEIKPEELGLSVDDQAIFYLTAGDNRTTYFNDDPSPNVTRSKNYSFTVTEPKKSPSGQSDPKAQGPPPSDKGAGKEPNQSDDKSDSGDASDTSDKGDSGANSDEESKEGNESGDEGEPNSGSETGSDDAANDPGQQNQSNENDPSQPSQGSPDDNFKEGSDGTSDPKSSEENPSESQDAGGPDGNQTPESAPEDGGSGTAEQSPQDAAARSNGGNESPPDGGEPKNNGDGTGGDEQPSGSDPSTDASEARQGSDSGGNDVSDTAPEKRDETLTEGEEQLSKEASEAEQVRQLDKLTSENRETREKPAGEDQGNPEQEPSGGDTPEGDQTSKSESPQPEQEGAPSADPNKESEQSPGAGNQSDQDQQPQDPANPEQGPNSQGSDSKGAESESPKSSQQAESSDSKSSSESSSEGSPKPDAGGSANDPLSQQADKPQGPEEPSSEADSKPKPSESDSGDPNAPDAKASQESDPMKTPGDEPAKQEGQPTESSPSSEPSPPSDQPGDQPPAGSPSGQQPSGPASKAKPGEQPPNDGERKASDGDVGTEALRREKENLEYARKKIDLLLDDLRKQRHDPDEELLRRMNWDKQDLNDFVDSWDDMQAAAEQGDEQAKLALRRRQSATGLRPDSKRRSVAGNEQEAGALNQIGEVNEPPPEERHNFNLFLQDLQRARP